MTRPRAHLKLTDADRRRLAGILAKAARGAPPAPPPPPKTDTPRKGT